MGWYEVPCGSVSKQRRARAHAGKGGEEPTHLAVRVKLDLGMDPRDIRVVESDLQGER